MGINLLGQTNMFCLIMLCLINKDDAPSSLSLSSFINIFYSESFFKTNKQKTSPRQEICWHLKFFFLLILVALHGIQNLRSEPGVHPLLWKHRALTSKPLGKSPLINIFN